MLQGLPVILTEPLQYPQDASLLAENKLVIVSHPPARPISLHANFFLFPGMNQDFKHRRSADTAWVQ